MRKPEGEKKYFEMRFWDGYDPTVRKNCIRNNRKAWFYLRRLGSVSRYLWQLL